MVCWGGTYVLHFLGSAYPSSPGLMAMLLIDVLQPLHCRQIRVALERIDDAAITIPDTFTKSDICSDCK